MNTYHLVDAVNDLRKKGYLDQVFFGEGKLVNKTKGIELPIGKFMVDSAYRFETGEKGDDTSIVYAVSANDRSFKGLFIDAFNVNENAVMPESAENVVEAEHKEGDFNSKFGLTKIHKADFNENPDRYILRKGFPDFPQCPFGQSFTMLGFDTEKDEYVWLVTSVIKDPRLQVVNFGEGNY